jgi:two-component system CheB/CheR fusion protein
MASKKTRTGAGKAGSRSGAKRRALRRPATKAPPAKPQPRAVGSPRRDRFPIVVIGASAGGLQAFKQLFSHMPADPGLAFVLIPHLDPTHKSFMVELLAKQTTMPVAQAEDRMTIRANHVYVIPPDRYLAVRQRQLLLSAPPPLSWAATAIDHAMRSLAEDEKEDAIGIVLSGTGSHGTAGLKDIKQSGGMAMVQDPATAQYDQMPRSALAGGVTIDYVLPPEKMGETLVEYAKRVSAGGARRARAPDAGTLNALDTILGLVRSRTRGDFRPYRKNMLLRRIQRRMALLKIDNLQKYVDRLGRDDPELLALRHGLSIGVTAFFREPEAFAVLADKVLTKLVQRASAESPVRVWVPACSTGEEAYTLAILLFEKFRDLGKEAQLQIFASDIDEESLKFARHGVYADGSLATLPADRLRNFFVSTDSRHHQVSNPMREAVVFALQNLISDPPFSRLDLISCRNVLIYLEPDIQAKVLPLLHFSLKEGGHLLLGPAESIGAAVDLFEPVSRRWRVYRRIGVARRDLSLPIGRSRANGARSPVPETHRTSAEAGTEAIRKILLDEFAPAAVLVNRRYEIISVHGPAVDYLEFPRGKLSHDLMAMARDNLRTRIRRACHKAISTGQVVRDMGARVRREGRNFLCNISVRPIVEPGPMEGLLLVVFQDGGPIPTAGRGRGSVQDFSAMRQLEDEFHATRDDLQRTIEELEHVHEDHKASNEENMSMYEELQSANEELETSKEELQSLNEELSTVNSQLEDKVTELDAANSDLSSLMGATDIAILFLDRDLRIKRFTAPAAKLLSVLPGDIGRPAHDLAPLLTGGNITAEARRVIETGAPVESEVRSAAGRDYLRRILPYQDSEGPKGVVVVYFDVTDRLQAEAQNRLLAAVLRDSRDAVFVCDLAGHVTAWNRGAEAMYGYSESEALKLSVRDLAVEEDRAQALDFIARAARGEDIPASEIKRRMRDGRILDIWASVTLLRDAWRAPAGVAITERDITERRQTEERIRAVNASLEKRVGERTREVAESRERMRAILDAATDAIVTIDRTGKIVTFNRSAERLFRYAPEQAIGMDVGMLMPPAERRQHRGFVARYLETHQARILGRPREVKACRQDGTIFPMRLSVAEIDHLGLFVGIIHDLTDARTLQNEILNIAMLEQQRVGQELHDGIQQELTGLGLLAQNLMDTLATKAGANAELARRVAAGLSEVNLHVRTLARGLVPVPVDPQALSAALGELARSTAENYGLSCQFDCPNPVTVNSANTATHLYRIAQEAVGNALKHAKAKAIGVRLADGNGALSLEIRDNGKGISAKIGPHLGIGLRLMEHRCSIIGGRFNVERQAEGGTRVVCTIPEPGNDAHEKS